MPLFFEQHSPLGKSTEYPEHYQPSLLFSIPRKEQRLQIGIPEQIPFDGYDLWNAYELSWLTPEGKPVVAIGEFRIPAQSPKLIESKSLKLYLNSFNQMIMASIKEVEETIRNDLSRATESQTTVSLTLIENVAYSPKNQLPGESIDATPVTIDCYEVNSELLKSEKNHIVEETLHTNLLKSNCLVTSQPDWASLMIRYRGPKITRAALLKYIISFRRHQGFHEQCVEQIFYDIKKICEPEYLSVYARYTRRGGLDINPFRSDFEQEIPNDRLPRQ